MLSAAIRDLHATYPGKYLTDIRTACPDLWENNPHITPIRDDDRSARHIDCDCELLNSCNVAPYHYVHGFTESLSRRLGINIRPTVFRGDIHLSEQEKAWYSQVHEVAGRDMPFWIVLSGGKFDATVKWWEVARFQKVIDHFRGRIQFVQVGDWGHWHPPLKGVIDLRGQTTLRELVRLVYHAQGVLCSVTALMHLAAAVETKPGNPPNRACVVIAGGREPVQWEAYPHHQYIHRNGALTCCAQGGCWKDRVKPLGDGDLRDEATHLCVQPHANLPRCMELISAAEVIGRIETYFEGGALRYLSPVEVRTGKRAVRKQLNNGYDQQPLSLASAGLACDAVLEKLPFYAGTFGGRGIVIPAGGLRYLPSAWVCIKMLRHHGCTLPVELWHNGAHEMDAGFRRLAAKLNVVVIDAQQVARHHPARRLGGWELKPYAILHSNFRDVLLLDADNVPVRDPEYLFDSIQFREHGAIFWPDYGHDPKGDPAWKCLGLERPSGLEFESGQVLVDKERCWQALRITMWINENSDFFYKHVHGDKDTFHLGFARTGKSFAFVPHPIRSLTATMCQHDFAGERVFQHRNFDKWNLHRSNRRIEGFLFETECFEYLDELRRRWDGGSRKFIRKLQSVAIARRQPPKIVGTMISCRARAATRRRTLSALAQTDLQRMPVDVQIDDPTIRNRQARQVDAARRALRAALGGRFDFLLFLEDDLAFNRHLLHNLRAWSWLMDYETPIASLYKPLIAQTAVHANTNATFVSREMVYGSQAFVLSRVAVKNICEKWNSIEGMQDIRISRLACDQIDVAVYHTPSLVQHVGKNSTWGGRFHFAHDFDPDWKAVMH